MPSTFALLTHAAGKKAGAFLRSLGATPVHPQWRERAEICARCPIAVRTEEGVFCGKPFLAKLHREPQEGCGCPVSDKAQDPAEHCPVTEQLEAASPEAGGVSESGCGCKWCVRLGR